MGHNVTLGGDRLGGGKKNKVYLSGFERSTHDLSYNWRSTIAPGTLVPFMTNVALPGDTFDIDLEVDVRTLPTLGPLFGSFKVHLDVFFAPMRLYIADLMQNRLGIGNRMYNVFLPQMVVEGNVPVYTKPLDNQQIHPSCILKYLGISGTGFKATMPNDRQFNAVPYLAYWEIYKQYYANKQENVGKMVHINPTPVTQTLASCTMYQANPLNQAIVVAPTAPNYITFSYLAACWIEVVFSGGTLTTDFQLNSLEFLLTVNGVTGIVAKADQLFGSWTVDIVNQKVRGTGYIYPSTTITIGQCRVNASYLGENLAPTVYSFPLSNIDAMKTTILANAPGTALILSTAFPANAPYSAPFQKYQTAVGPPVVNNYSMMFSQEGLALRTYASDIMNNWLDTNVVNGGPGIQQLTNVNVVSNQFTIDELNLKSKVYEMLNRIAISGGTYDDWLDAVYSHDRMRQIQTPIYLGGKLANLVFQEVIGMASTDGQPLGTLAGRGAIQSQGKGGRITAKIDEPGYIIGIASLVPRLDYSQGNEWDTNLKTMDDLHKPGLDEIGFQNLVTDQMAWWDTLNVSQTSQTFRSAGYQPAWMNYMTDVNKNFGEFANPTGQMWMVLNRRYNYQVLGGVTRIADLTTYIDPSKFNQIFADTRVDAQNFWMQIGCKIEARRKMSGKIIPNL